jgi:hypothetical protein
MYRQIVKCKQLHIGPRIKEWTKISALLSFYSTTTKNALHTHTILYPPQHQRHTPLPPDEPSFLFKNLSISDRFPRNRFIPRPRIPNKLLIGLGLGIQFLEVVALPIGRDVKGSHMVVAADKEGPADGAVVVLAEDKETAEEEFAGGFEAGEEPGDEVGGLEG